MNRLWKEMQWFLQQKIYLVAMIITAVCSYGFAIVSPGLGIDDTATGLYFSDGLAVVMGRWVIFLINKVLNVAEYAPFMVDFIGVLLLMMAAVLMCVLLKRIFGDRISIWGYIIFLCVFLSNPMISEVYIYYLHNGLGIGYVLTALAFLAWDEMLNCKGKKKIPYVISNIFLMWIAIGCYESFLIMYLLGVIVILFFRAMVDKEKLTFAHIVKNIGILALVAVGCMILRQTVIASLTAIYDLSDLLNMMKQRNLSEMLVLFQGRAGFDNFLMLVKRFWVVYHLNALVFLPITGYEIAVIGFGVVSVVLAVRRKNLWYPVLFLGMLIVPFLLTIAEANLTLYRSCQYMPFFTAAGMLLLYQVITHGKYGMKLRTIALLLAGILVYNQAACMNESFYLDYKKYENTKDVLLQVAYQVESEYGTDTPIVFTGHHELPHEFLEKYYVSYSSWQYRQIARMTDLVDVHLKEKYFSPYGYSFVGNAIYSYIQWGLDAFDGTNREMIHFLELHGYSFKTVTNPNVLEDAHAIGATMPRWPADGSVSMQDGYILIHM